jgi:uncharacterized surface protein with fasciclin (FAS1) repeats
MIMKRMTWVALGFCALLGALLYILVKYQTDLADGIDEKEDVIHVLAKQKDLSTLTELIEKAGLHPILEKASSATLMAPTNKAFEELRSMVGEDAYNRITHDAKALQKLLEHHIIPNKETTANISEANKLNTLEGTPITVKSSDGTIRLDDSASIIPDRSDIDTGNVMIHSVDEVMMPPRLE